jgi:30S ribosomal protein S31
MGKGDIKTKRGKITNKSFGKRRSHKVIKKAERVQEEKTQKQSA